jgi:hypothetical protein
MNPETRLALVKAVQAANESSTELERAAVDLLDGQAEQLAATKALEARVSSQSGEMRAIKGELQQINATLSRLAKQFEQK